MLFLLLVFSIKLFWNCCEYLRLEFEEVMEEFLAVFSEIFFMEGKEVCCWNFFLIFAIFIIVGSIFGTFLETGVIIVFLDEFLILGGCELNDKLGFFIRLEFKSLWWVDERLVEIDEVEVFWEGE